ncbi:MAG: hypothetical protein J6V09_06575 [Clostridia bacterium]|nr:hypothetical protein [Clostridia bacterium]
MGNGGDPTRHSATRAERGCLGARDVKTACAAPFRIKDTLAQMRSAAELGDAVLLDIAPEEPE